MNEVYIHLLLNHVPVLTTLFGIPVLAYGWFRKQEQVMQVGLAFFVLGAIAALPVYFSGEGAEEAVEHLPGVIENLIEQHEDFAKIAMFFAEGLGLASLLALFALPRKPELARWVLPLIFVLSMGSAGTIIQTAHLGGQIRHSEIRAGASGGNTQNLTQSENRTKSKGDHDDDDDND